MAENNIETAEILNRPDYYYDVRQKKLLVFMGRAALEEFETSNIDTYLKTLERMGRVALVETTEDSDLRLIEESQNYIKLSRALLNNTAILSDVPEPLDTSSWDKARYINYASWLWSVLSDDERENMSLPTLFDRASDLELGPNYRKTSAKFYKEGLSGLYVPAGIGEVRRRAFDNWSIEDFVSHMINIRMQIRKKPSKQVLLKRINQDKLKEPSPEIIVKRLGSLRTLHELSGEIVVDGWEERDFLDWGVKCMIANNGVIPSEVAIDYLSQKGFGPASKTIQNHFKSISKYQKQLQKAYRDRCKDTQEQVIYIKMKLSKLTTFMDLFAGTTSDHEKVMRLSRYKLISSVELPFN